MSVAWSQNRNGKVQGVDEDDKEGSEETKSRVRMEMLKEVKTKSWAQSQKSLLVHQNKSDSPEAIAEAKRA